MDKGSSLVGGYRSKKATPSFDERVALKVGL